MKKILIAVDDSIHSKNAVKYIINLSSLIKGLSYTLFNVQPSISQFIVDEAKSSLKTKSALAKLQVKNEENALMILEKYKNQMIEKGINANRIDLKTQRKKIGLAKDVLEYAQDKLYDAIVVGRRGLSRVQEVFMGSLTTHLTEHSRVIPVWIIDGEVNSNKIMIAIDGSESALRAVDHFSFMFSDCPNIQITLVHIIPRLKDFCKIDFKEKDEEIEELIIEGDKRCIEDFLVHAYKKFKDAGIAKEQIHIKEIHVMSNIGGTIIEEAKKGNYGTVIVGRRGISKAFFMGSVSKYVLDKISNQTLWLVS